jgi:hypothetical protein
MVRRRRRQVICLRRRFGVEMCLVDLDSTAAAEEEVKEQEDEDEVDAAATVVAKAGAHGVTTAAK